MEILKADLTDAEEILALQKRAFIQEAELYGDYNVEPLTVCLENTIDEFKRSVVLKMVHEGKIIGSVRGMLKDNACHVGKLIVEPQFQNKGHGASLMRAIEKEFPDCKWFELFTGAKSENNIHLYKKLGYKITGTERLNSKIDLVNMVKDNTVK
jgi:ribosomal protein S18 acetylase RimI-like enzyme